MHVQVQFIHTSIVSIFFYISIEYVLKQQPNRSLATRGADFGDGSPNITYRNVCPTISSKNVYDVDYILHLASNLKCHWITRRTSRWIHGRSTYHRSTRDTGYINRFRLTLISSITTESNPSNSSNGNPHLNLYNRPKFQFPAWMELRI